MKSLVIVVALVIFNVSGIAQSDYSSNNTAKTQDELYTSLNKAQVVKGTGTVIALAGCGLLVASLVKAVQLDEEYGSREVPEEENKKWASMVVGGSALTVLGLGVRLGGKSKEKKINAELVKYQSSAIGYGVGLKIGF